MTKGKKCGNIIKTSMTKGQRDKAMTDNYVVHFNMREGGWKNFVCPSEVDAHTMAVQLLNKHYFGKWTGPHGDCYSFSDDFQYQRTTAAVVYDEEWFLKNAAEVERRNDPLYKAVKKAEEARYGLGGRRGHESLIYDAVILLKFYTLDEIVNGDDEAMERTVVANGGNRGHTGGSWGRVISEALEIDEDARLLREKVLPQATGNESSEDLYQKYVNAGGRKCIDGSLDVRWAAIYGRALKSE